jgi:hypothetical protein
LFQFLEQIKLLEITNVDFDVIAQRPRRSIYIRYWRKCGNIYWYSKVRQSHNIPWRRRHDLCTKKTFEKMERFSSVRPVTGLNRPNTGKEDEESL